eukprot:806955_1
MSRRDVIGEAGEKPSNENDNLVELHKSEHPQNAQQIEEQIKDKHEQHNPSDKAKQHSISTYLVIFQWILLIFCVVSNIYLLSKPDVQCECDGSSAQSQIISIVPTTNSPTKHPTISSETTTSYPFIRSSIDPTIFPSTQPTPKPTNNPSFEPTNNPSFDPSTGPTKQPTRIPSTRPTAQPSLAPSELPSQSPTYFDGYFVGDYKYSFRNESHGFWLLCHGQWLEITEYSLLYDVIGHTFGHYYNGTTHYFRVPDARDTVMGVIGSAHQMGERTGNEIHKLSQSEMPEHIHYFVGEDSITPQCDNSATGTYVAGHCWTDAYFSAYWLQRSSIFNTSFHTSESGANQSFSLMQPTKFIGNLFVYSGEIHS